MSSNVLADRDVNGSAPQLSAGSSADVKSMDYHRQVLQSRLEEGKHAYISPSDNIMSPCTAKLSAYRSKHVMKAKPRSLFSQAAGKNFPPAAQADNLPEKEKKAGE